MMISRDSSSQNGQNGDLESIEFAIWVQLKVIGNPKCATVLGPFFILETWTPESRHYPSASCRSNFVLCDYTITET